MKKFQWAILSCMFMVFTSWAESQNPPCEDQIVVQVNGLVCDFCARALEKVFGKRSDVLAIDVDLNQGKVSINMQSGQTIDDATLRELITDSGYNVVAINKGCEND